MNWNWKEKILWEIIVCWWNFPTHISPPYLTWGVSGWGQILPLTSERVRGTLRGPLVEFHVPASSFAPCVSWDWGTVFSLHFRKRKAESVWRELSAWGRAKRDTYLYWQLSGGVCFPKPDVSIKRRAIWLEWAKKRLEANIRHSFWGENLNLRAKSKTKLCLYQGTYIWRLLVKKSL